MPVLKKKKTTVKLEVGWDNIYEVAGVGLNKRLGKKNKKKTRLKKDLLKKLKKSKFH